VGAWIRYSSLFLSVGLRNRQLLQVTFCRCAHFGAAWTQDRYRRLAEKSVAQLFRHSSFGSTWPSTIHDASPSKATAVTMIFLRNSSFMTIWTCSRKGAPKTVLTGIQLNNMNQLTPSDNFEGEESSLADAQHRLAEYDRGERELYERIVAVAARAQRGNSLKRLGALLDNSRALTSQDSWRGVA
jgi:hypothetical protein